MRGKFIVFEGLDGTGTSTQARLLHEYLQGAGLRSYVTSEPSDGPIGTMIRQIFSGRINMASGVRGDFDSFDEQMAYLFAADRHDHLYNPVNGVVRLVDDGGIVISTRYYFSSLAYHCNGEEDERFVRGLNSRFPDPDLLIYLRGCDSVSMERISKRKHRDSYENNEKLRAVYANYERLLDSYKGELAVIDAGLSISLVHESVLNAVRRLIYA